MTAEIDQLIFKPINKFMSCGDELQTCLTNFKGIDIIERTFFPWTYLKEPTVSYLPDLIIAKNSKLYQYCNQNDIRLSDAFYTEEGFEMPVCKTLEQSIGLINYFKETLDQVIA